MLDATLKINFYMRFYNVRSYILESYRAKNNGNYKKLRIYIMLTL